jgi:hypothetical protein
LRWAGSFGDTGGSIGVSGAFSRAELVARGGRSGAALLLAGSAFGPAAAEARADVLPDDDLAFARLLVAVELLSVDFYANAIAAKRLGRAASADLRRAAADEQKHYDAAAAILTGAGQVPATADDIDFSYAAGSFASAGSIAKLGLRLESLALGAYLGAVGGYVTQSLKLPAAQIAANEAQHRSVFTALAQGVRIGPAFAAPLTIAQVSDGLDAFTS